MEGRSFHRISGELAGPELEAAFRDWSRVDHATRVRIAYRVAAVLMTAFCAADLGYHGFSLLGFALCAARIMWASAALSFAARVDAMPMRALDRFSTMLAATAVFVVIASTAVRPSGFQPHTVTNAAVVLATYLLLPLRFRAAVAIGAAHTIFYLVVCARGAAIAPAVAIAGGFALANGIGATGNAWVARVGRSEFLRVRAAEEAHEERLAFLASTSHELRSPLHGIMACAELLAGTSLDEDQRGLVRLIRSSGVAMAGLLEEAVHQVRGGHELPAVDPKPIDLHAFQDDICAFVRARAASHGVVVTSRREASVPRHVQADSARLRQVLLNFAENALAHGAKANIVVAIDARPRLADGRVALEFSVIDDGPGVPRELRESILRPFVQANRAAAGLRGMGLGLAICDRIARAMDARIEIDDAPEGGACFRFCVSLREATPESERDDQSAIERRGLEVLLVEDEAVSRRLMSLLLERDGHQVTVATSGEEAIARVSDHRFDVVLMDLRLPRMDGIEAMRKITTEHANGAPPVLAMSAHAALADHAELLSAGFRAVMPKPVELDALRATLAQLATGGTPRKPRSAEPAWLDDALLTPHIDVLGESEVAKLLELFVDSSGPVMAELGIASEAGRLADVAALAHRLGGAAESVALLRCSSEAATLESTARSGEPVSAALLQSLRSTYNASCERALGRASELRGA